MKNSKELIRYATKAPSGHNSQPWKFKIDENSIEIHPDFDFALPVVDPSHRELYVSLGCAAENLRQAALAFGNFTDLSIEKSPKGTTFIRMGFTESGKKSDKDMLRLIEKRQTNRGIYDGKKIAENQINGLKEIAKEENVNVHFCENGSDHFTIIKQYIKRGNTIQMNNEKFKDELLSWIRFNKGHVNDTNNGLTYKVMGSPPTPKFMGRAIVKSFLTPEKQNKSDVKKIDSASHFMLLTTKNDSKTEWIHLGRYMQRLLLQLTKMGIANAYLNPPCELSELRSGLQKELPINNELPTILVRLGYAKPAPFSPRKDVEEVISTVKSIV